VIKLGKKTAGFLMPNPLEGVEIPEWQSVREFAKWWADSGCPLAPPSETVNLSDDATSFALFRYGQFQVELYLIHPSPNLPRHEHPDVEVIKMRLDTFLAHEGSVIKTSRQEASTTLYQGESHGAGQNFKEKSGLDTGFGLLAFQKWKDGLTPTTVAARWKGETVGPKQEDLIRKLTPKALVRDGYADTTGAP
jgi:hypothetical protein